MIVPIGCKANCKGEGYPCIVEILLVLEQGNVAFMLYANHVMDKLRTMNLNLEVKYQNEIPVGVYISEKGAPSVYDRFQ